MKTSKIKHISIPVQGFTGTLTGTPKDTDEWTTRAPSDALDDFLKPRRVYQPLYGESGDFMYLNERVRNLEEDVKFLKNKTIYGKYLKVKDFCSNYLNPRLHLTSLQEAFIVGRYWFKKKLDEAKAADKSQEKPVQDPPVKNIQDYWTWLMNPPADQ